jgi:cysteinyl-tRNA synthetase, unknown class
VANNAIDGLGLESVFYMAHDKPANEAWCIENRENALAIRKAGKLILGVDYAKRRKSIVDAYKKQRELGFIPYVSVEPLDRIQRENKSNKSMLRHGT